MPDILESELHSSAAFVALRMGTARVFFEKENDPLQGRQQVFEAMESACDPLTRTIPTPPSPAGVATAQIVSSKALIL